MRLSERDSTNKKPGVEMKIQLGNGRTSKKTEDTATKSVLTKVDKKDQEESLVEFVKEKFDEAVRDSIPLESMKKLPRTYLYITGLLLQLSAIGIFIGFMVSTYQSQAKQEFIAASPSSGKCKTVPRPFSGSFEATYDGDWEGSSGFKPNLAMYQFTFINMNAQYYKGYMEGVQSIINNKIGPIAAQQPLPINLLFWMNFQYASYTADNYLESFTFSGYPSVVFNTAFQAIDIFKQGYSCTLPRELSFDSSTSHNLVSFDAPTYLASEACNHTMNPYLFGYSDLFPESSFDLKVDMITFTTAAAVNLKIQSYAVLQKAESMTVTVPFEGYNYTLSYLYDTGWQAMTPVLCVSDAPPNSPLLHQCFLWYVAPFTTAVTLVYPVMNHYGYEPEGSSTRHQCTCPMTADMAYCNVIDMVSNLVFYSLPSPDADAASLIPPLFALLQKYTPLEMMANVFNASNTKNFSFCDTEEFGSCSIVGFSNYGVFETEVSPEFYEVPYGACNNTFSSPYFQEIIDKAPVYQYESYYKCTLKPPDMFITAVGVSAGNTSAMLPLVMLILLTGLYNALKAKNLLPEPEEYDADERDNMLRELSTIMLQIRDGKDTGLGGHDTVLRELVQGLIKGATSKEAEEKLKGRGHTTGRLGTLRKGVAVEQKAVVRRSMFKRKLRLSSSRLDGVSVLDGAATGDRKGDEDEDGEDSEAGDRGKGREMSLDSRGVSFTETRSTGQKDEDDDEYDDVEANRGLSVSLDVAYANRDNSFVSASPMHVARSTSVTGPKSGPDSDDETDDV